VPTTVGYTTREELARILKIRQPSSEQNAALDRCLTTAQVEIDAEIDLADAVTLTAPQLELAAEVQLERSVEHWRQEESPFGLVGLGAEMGQLFSTKDTWDRHAYKLAPLKNQWGLA